MASWTQRGCCSCRHSEAWMRDIIWLYAWLWRREQKHIISCILTYIYTISRVQAEVHFSFLKNNEKRREKTKMQPQSMGVFLRQPRFRSENCYRREVRPKLPWAVCWRIYQSLNMIEAYKIEAAARSIANGSGEYCVFCDVAESFILLDTIQ